MTDPRRLAALARLAAIRKERCIGALAQAERQVRAVGARIAALDTALAEARLAAGGADPATLAALDAFGRRSAERRLDLTERLSEAERIAAARRAAARLAFGRANALERLTGEAEAERRRLGAKS